jgi:GAF domain-containing protein
MISSLNGNGAHDYERVLELVVRLSGRLDQPTLFEDVLCSVGSFWGAEAGALLLSDPDATEGRLSCTISVPEEFTALLGGSFGAEMLRRLAAARSPIIVDPLEHHPLHRRFYLRQDGPTLRSACFHPLVGSAGVFVGGVGFYYGRAPAEHGAAGDLAALLLPPVAQVIANARTNALLRQQATQYRTERWKLQLVAEACMSLTSEDEEETTLRKAARLATRWIAEGCVIDLVDRRGRFVRTAASSRTRSVPAPEQRATAAEETRRKLVLQLLRSGTPMVLRDVDPQECGMGFVAGASRRWQSAARATILLIPLSRGNASLGALAVLRSDAGGADTAEEDLLLAGEIARHTVLAVQGARRKERGGGPSKARLLSVVEGPD